MNFLRTISALRVALGSSLLGSLATELGLKFATGNLFVCGVTCFLHALVGFVVSAAHAWNLAFDVHGVTVGRLGSHSQLEELLLKPFSRCTCVCVPCIYDVASCGLQQSSD